MKNELYEQAKQAVAEKWNGTGAKWENIDWYALNYAHHQEDWYQECDGMGDLLIQEAAELYAQWMCNEAVKADRKIIGAALDDYAIQYEGRVERNEKWFNDTFPLPFPPKPDER